MHKPSLILLIIGGLIMAFGVWFVASAYASVTWDQVEGTVIKPKVVTRLKNASNAQLRSLEYIVEVDYAYRIDGIRYMKSRYSLGMGNTFQDGFSERSDARNWLKSSPYQSGSTIRVYVDPNDPNNTVISSGASWPTFVPLIMSFLFIGLALFNMHYISKQKGS